jgi:calpain-15
LIERLFITKEWNKEGIYRVKICKGGEWIEVTVDDLFPCEPNGDPLFTSCIDNEIWVMVLEKAYAKVHGSYYMLKGGFTNEALIDLTGCPTSCYNLKDDYVKHFVKNG